VHNQGEVSRYSGRIDHQRRERSRRRLEYNTTFYWVVSVVVKEEGPISHKNWHKQLCKKEHIICTQS